jgi:hypothetical protein
MKQYTKARIAAGLAVAVFLAAPSYIKLTKYQHAGREAYLATQAKLYDARLAHPSPLRDATTALVLTFLTGMIATLTSNKTMPFRSACQGPAPFAPAGSPSG